MALSGSTVWEVRTAGTDTNGGGFVTGSGGTDYSQQDSKNTVGTDISTTDGVANGTTTFTSATANFGASIVGNIIFVSGGTGAIAAQWRQVTARASSTSITLDVLIAASTGMTVNIGGALLSPAVAVSVAIASNVIWIKSGTYTISSGSSNVANGVISGTAANMRVEGYGSARGDLGTAPVLQASGIASVTLVIWGANLDTILRNITVDGQSLTAIKGFTVARGVFYKLTAKNCLNTGIGGAANAIVISCVATGCNLGIVGCSGHINCETYSNTGSGIQLTATSGYADNCLSYNNSGASSDGIQITGQSVTAVNCTCYGNGRDGVRSAGNNTSVINSVGESNVGFGINLANVSSSAIYCATFGNGGGSVNLAGANSVALNNVTGSSSFFVNAAGTNFALNNTAGAGAVCRAAAAPGTFPSGTTTSYHDIGAAQHQDTPATNLFIVQD